MRSIALALCAFLFCSCASMQSDSAMNDSCPFSGNPVKADAVVTHGGEEVGFCCARCVSKFEGMSDEEKAKTVAKLK